MMVRDDAHKMNWGRRQHARIAYVNIPGLHDGGLNDDWSWPEAVDHAYPLVQLVDQNGVQNINNVEDDGQWPGESLSFDTGRCGPVLGYVDETQIALVIHDFSTLQNMEANSGIWNTKFLLTHHQTDIMVSYDAVNPLSEDSSIVTIYRMLQYCHGHCFREVEQVDAYV